MSNELKSLLVETVEKEYKNRLIYIKNNLARFKELLLKVSKQKKYKLTLWVVGEDTNWEVKKDLDLLEKTQLIIGEMGYSDQSGYREYSLTEKGNKVIQKLTNQNL